MENIDFASIVPLTVQMTEAFHEKLATVAAQRDLSLSDFVRQVLAKEVQWPYLDKEPKQGRKQIYKTDEERKAAAKARYQEARDLKNMLLENYRQQQKAAAIKALSDSIERNAK